MEILLSRPTFRTPPPFVEATPDLRVYDLGHLVDGRVGPRPGEK